MQQPHLLLDGRSGNQTVMRTPRCHPMPTRSCIQVSGSDVQLNRVVGARHRQGCEIPVQLAERRLVRPCSTSCMMTGATVASPMSISLRRNLTGRVSELRNRSIQTVESTSNTGPSAGERRAHRSPPRRRPLGSQCSQSGFRIAARRLDPSVNVRSLRVPPDVHERRRWYEAAARR